MEVRNIAAEPGPQKVAGLIGWRRGPQAWLCCLSLAVVVALRCKGVNPLAFVAQRQMQMRELGFPREANLAKLFTSLYLLAFFDADRAALHVAILRFPAVFMPYDNAVAAFAALQVFGSGFCRIGIGHRVPQALDDTGSRCPHSNAASHICQIGQGDISALVAGIAQRLTAIVFSAGARVMVDILLDATGLAKAAVNRPLQGYVARHGRCRDEREKERSE